MKKEWLWVAAAVVVAYLVWANFIQKAKVTTSNA